MALVSLNSNSLHGFKASLEIDRIFFGLKKIYVSEAKTVDGMPDVKWYIKMYPTDPSDADYFGIYAYIESESEKEIEYKINHRQGTFTEGTKEILITQENLVQFFRYNRFDGNGKYQVRFEGSVSYKNRSSFFPKICNPTHWGLRLKQNSEEDFEIGANGESFKVHKFILAAESPIFKKMFENDFKEAHEGKVIITDSNPEIVKVFIDYCYGQDISIENDTDIINLLYFADKYDCQTLKPQMESYLASKISKENISLYVSTADKTNAVQLRQACVQFVRNLLNNNGDLTAEEMESFDMKFVKDVFAFTAKQ